MISKKPKTIAEYIKSAPKASQTKLKEVLKILDSVVPNAKKGLKWGMPAFSYKRILFIVGGFKHHIGLYPTTSAMQKFTKELSKLATATGSVQFPLDKPLPVSLIRKIAKFRVKESIEQDGKWRS